jgi:hypothetical protein
VLEQVDEVADRPVFMVASPLERMLGEMERQRAVRAEYPEPELLEAQAPARRRVGRGDRGRREVQVGRLFDPDPLVRRPACLAQPGAVRLDAFEQTQRSEQLEATGLASELPQRG